MSVFQIVFKKECRIFNITEVHNIFFDDYCTKINSRKTDCRNVWIRLGEMRNDSNILITGIQRMGTLRPKRRIMAGMKRDVKNKHFKLLTG
jgi:hypothetical protein